MRNITLKRTITFLASVTLIAMLTSALVRAQATSSGASAGGTAVHALFDLTSPARGPFPSDRFTLLDQSHNTGLRVNLPKPDCGERPSDCEDISVLNTLDGFNMQPRLSIPFDGSIDVNSVTSQTVFLIRLGSTLLGGERGSQLIGINQIVWDPATNTLHVESDELLNQHTRYALIVTNGVRDQSGVPVEASEAFRRFRQTVRGDYKQALLEAIHAARRLGLRESEIVTASVFTTQSATAILEKIRDQIKAVTPAPADFNLGPGGSRTVFPLDDVTGIVWRQQTRDNPPDFTNVNLNLSSLRHIPGALGQIAFGKFVSPDYETAKKVIPPVGTRTGTPVVQSVNEIFFNLYLPSGAKPATGWPVAIFGHGSGGSKQGNAVWATAATLAERGIATIAISAVGHGFGPLGTLMVSTTRGESITFPAGGRGIDLNRDGVITDREGVRPIRPWTIIDIRDGFRQTAVDLMQLVRHIEVGLDVEGDGASDLDPSRIYYVGVSWGGAYGLNFLGVEPSVRVAVLLVTSGSTSEGTRLGPGSRPRFGNLFAARIPSLVNMPGVISLEDVPVGAPQFHENLPLRDGVPLTVRLANGAIQEIRSPVINAVAGAMAIQEWFDRTEWAEQSGEGLAHAPHLRKAPLAGVPAKSLLYPFAKGDQIWSNPSQTAVLRAGDLADRATYYRNDLAYAEDPMVPKDPHTFANRIDSPNALVRAIAYGAHQQIAIFLASDGNMIIHPEPRRFFEVPITSPLPEELNFIP